MSTTYPELSTFARAREEAQATVDFDEELAEAAVRLLASGPVGFKLSTRVSASTLPKPKRRVCAVLRRLPERYFVPYALAKQEGFYDDWRVGVAACESPDDQLLAMPKNRRYGGGWSLAVECRPLDESDRRRFLTLDAVFSAHSPEYPLPPGLAEAVEELKDVARMAKDA